MVAQSVEKIRVVRVWLKIAQDRQKKWADIWRRLLEFEVSDRVFLKVSPTHGLSDLGSMGSLVHDTLDYLILLIEWGLWRADALPPVMVGIHNNFYVSQLRKCVGKDKLILNVFEVELVPDLSFEQRPKVIVDRRVKELNGDLLHYYS